MNSLRSVLRVSWVPGICRRSASFTRSVPVSTYCTRNSPGPVTAGSGLQRTPRTHGPCDQRRELGLGRPEKRAGPSTATRETSEVLTVRSAGPPRTASRRPSRSLGAGRSKLGQAQRCHPIATYLRIPATTRGLTTSPSETVAANEMAGPDKGKAGKKPPSVPQPSAR